MAWTSPKTWNYNEPLSFDDLNVYVRDNLNFLMSGMQRVLGQWVRTQTAQITAPTQNAWNNIDSNGITHIDVGAVQQGDILEIGAGAKCSATAGWTMGVRVYDNTTLLRTFVGANTSTGESNVIPAIYEFGSSYSNIIVYLAIYPKSSAGTLALASETDLNTWLNVTHKRPPIV
jgi:hypothetical protein